MLQLIRENAQGIVIWVIVGFIILGLSSFILSSYLGGNVKTYVAMVNDNEISDRQFRMAYNNRQSQLQQQLGENFSRFFNESMLRSSVVSALVNNELLNQLSFDAGFRVGPDQVQKELAKVEAFQDENGKFSNQKFASFVEQYGYSAKGYALEESQRLAKKQLLDGIANSALILNSDLADYQKLNRQQRDVGLLIINKAEVVKTIEVKEDDVKAYFESHTAEFMTEEQVSVDYLELSLKQLADEQVIDIDEVKDFYEKNKGRYTISGEREASHILIKLDDNTNDQAALAKLAVIQAKLKAGSSFAELAKENSDDKFSAKNGGKFGRINQEQGGNQAFNNALFALKAEGDVSQPVRSEFGYHLIKLDKIYPGKVKPFEEVQAVLERELKGQKAERIFYEGQSKLENLTYQHQDSLEPAAEEIGLKIKTSPLFSRRGGAQIFRNQEVISEAFSEEVIQESLNSHMVKLSDDHVVVFRLKEHQPAKPKTFEQVKRLVENKLKQEKATQLISDLARQTMDKLNTGTAASSLADGKKIIWQKYGFIGRQAKYDQVDATKKKPVKTNVREEARRAAFSLKKPATGKPEYHSMTANNGDALLIVLQAVRDNPMQEDDSVIEAVHKQLAQTIGAADSESVIEFMRSKSEIDINKTQDEVQ
ncbi:Peptidyl-prolyl cis-trans isomerase PpiD [hydrothermal vent metagenome]|uniref:Periplasmic chaperone PpiD n=1 Tax=hydrothermal vent metagenome TaxID=652676 RepID=A0A3B0ZT33_9ZZZZ